MRGSPPRRRQHRTREKRHPDDNTTPPSLPTPPQTACPTFRLGGPDSQRLQDVVAVDYSRNREGWLLRQPIPGVSHD